MSPWALVLLAAVANSGVEGAPLGAAELSPEPALEPPAKLAYRLFTEGQAHYDARRYDEALHAFGRANAIAPSPELLFDMAQCAMELRRFDEALAYYLDFARQSEDAEAKSYAAARVMEAERALAVARNRSLETEAAAAAARAEAPFYRSRWFWSAVAGAAVLTATTSAALHYRRHVEHRPPAGTLGTVDRR